MQLLSVQAFGEFWIYSTEFLSAIDGVGEFKQCSDSKMHIMFVLGFLSVAYVVSSVRAIGPLGSFGVGVGGSKCDPSITTASGTYAMHKGDWIDDEQTFTATEFIYFAASGQYCSGDLIFEDTFDLFDTRKWQHENTLSGGGVSNFTELLTAPKDDAVIFPCWQNCVCFRFFR